ncbi:hypothetical protein INT44_009007 [Umbelopsis vinacea]|uniref:Uncharacterized protein n=1 Tax=Umbelopsis vinacea TaxID=44442 RepID=A0A8H7UFN4_9FUNG|nr:hypothetical protein INT44_009007 [Umbelopsis vinacea]
MNQPESGQTVDEFCYRFKAACPDVVAANQPKATLNQVCEQAPKPGQANAYCTGTENGQITAYTTEVAAELLASLP